MFIKAYKYIKYLDAKKPETWMGEIMSEKNKKTKIFLINDYFTNNTAEVLKKLDKIIFHSDIRTNDQNDDFPSNLDVVWNNAQQLNWVGILKPLAYMLKFRVPYIDGKKISPQSYQVDDFKYSKDHFGIDFISDFNSSDFKYMGRKIIPASNTRHELEFVF